MTDYNSIYYWLWLSYGTGTAISQFNTVLNRFDSLQEAFSLAARGDKGAFAKVVTDTTFERLRTAANAAFMDKYIGWLKRHKVGVATLLTSEYPQLLKTIDAPPPVLFYRGSLKPDYELPIAVVGTRACSDYGKDMAKAFGRGLAAQGATVVTGLAAGIDSFAAAAALENANNSNAVVGVLGCGIDIVFPKENQYLYDAVAEQGAVVTEFLPQTEPLARNFPIRNRIISGMSRGVLVVEAKQKSGTVITANFALDQGRDVFAICGRLTDANSVGTNAMIAEGEAKMVLSVSDILDEYLDSTIDIPYNSSAKQVYFSQLKPLEQRIYLELEKGERSSDELMSILGCKVVELNSTLTAMEFSGIIKPLAGRLYARNTVDTVVIKDTEA